MKDRQPGAPGQYKAVITAAELQKLQSGDQFIITLTRDDQPLVEGTPYNKASVLPDELAALICPDVLDPTPADAFRALQENKLPSKWRPTAEEIGAATPPKLLWENASPTSQFAAQTITLDLSKYEAVEIEFYTTTNASSRRLKSYRCPVGFVSLLDAIWPNGTATMQFYTRSVSVTEAGVAFTAASMWYEKGSTQGIDAEQYTIIPYRIYGIKEGV